MLWKVLEPRMQFMNVSMHVDSWQEFSFVLLLVNRKKKWCLLSMKDLRRIRKVNKLTLTKKNSLDYATIISYFLVKYIEFNFVNL